MASSFIVNLRSRPISWDIENFGEGVAKYETDECNIIELDLLGRVNKVGGGKAKDLL